MIRGFGQIQERGVEQIQEMGSDMFRIRRLGQIQEAQWDNFHSAYLTFLGKGFCPSTNPKCSWRGFHRSAGTIEQFISSIIHFLSSLGFNGSIRSLQSIGPGLASSDPASEPPAPARSSKPRYFRHCLNHRQSTKYLGMQIFKQMMDTFRHVSIKGFDAPPPPTPSHYKFYQFYNILT